MFAVRNGKVFDLGFLNDDPNFLDAEEVLPKELLDKLNELGSFPFNSPTPEKLTEFSMAHRELWKWEAEHGVKVCFGQPCDESMEEGKMYGIRPSRQDSSRLEWRVEKF